MSKLLSLKDCALIAAAISGDAAVWFFGKGVIPSIHQSVLGISHRHKRDSYLSTVSRMLSVGDISRLVNKDGKVYLNLTSQGETCFKRRFPLFGFSTKKWDKCFMVVVFDLPEIDRKTRDHLRRKLVELGFGMLQKSVWISPYHIEEDLYEYLAVHALLDRVYIMTAKKLLTRDYRVLARKVWKIDSLEEKYLVIVKRLFEIDQQDLSVSQMKSKLRDVFEQYLLILVKDPLLPLELLPRDWVRLSLVQAFEKRFKQVV